MNALARYGAQDEKESEHICERVVPQFQHVNGSVVLAAVKVIMIHMRGVHREDLIKQLVRKMAPPLVTLLSSPPEVQWVALRNINLLLQKRPDILSNEMRVFFCKYNDPLYVKVEKLDIMVRLASEKNVDALLSELKEWVGIFLCCRLIAVLIAAQKVCVRGGRRLCPEEHKGDWADGGQNRRSCGTMCERAVGINCHASELCCPGSCCCHEGMYTWRRFQIISQLCVLGYLPQISRNL